jgi:pimeloyl-ACP methyl ester carboxylesterase
MGGASSQELALAAPGRVRSLTLAVSWPRSGAWARKLGEVWGARVATMTREQRVDELMLLTLSEAFFENADAVAWLRSTILANGTPQPAEAFARQIEATGRHNAGERLGELTMPVHVIGAEHDILVPVWKSRELAELIPGAKLTVIAGAPHGVNLERAEEFNRAVLDFIARTSS